MCSVALGTPAGAISLHEAVGTAVESNPEIGQAAQNREAIEFELRQARGLYMPRIDLEGSVGVRRLDNDSRRALGTEDDALTPTEFSAVVTQTLFNGGGRLAEKNRQAARVDSASFRVMERSEYIGLQVVREYLEYLLQVKIVQATASNLSYHRRIQENISSSISAGTLTEADRQQVLERVLAAEARMQEAEREQAAAEIRFLKLVGKPLGNASMPPSVSNRVPGTLAAAIGKARSQNPRVHLANADIDVADAEVDAARAGQFPEFFLEGRARTGYDIDGDDGRTHDFQARLVGRWRIYNGGIAKANTQEHVRRASEARLVLHQTHREIEESVRDAWDQRSRMAELAQTLRRQANQSALLVNSYSEQFDVGQRSLLDVLDAQNTRYNVEVLANTAQFSSYFADYKLLAATGSLLTTLGLSSRQQAEPYAREEFNVPPTQPTETYARVPSRQESGLPLDLLAPIR
ncbi:TolC family protein [Roseibium salinum]|uniref:TolC family protein n=1 Tax=Roseibium salinum TaxID=1604349 RepID=A0ABT3R487_9HYPH|nr:TolC family protein [Roseibium sp. DSM 29163]MCX2724086.1 TolC family protein [Roseibium sp. DSM 29163]